MNIIIHLVLKSNLMGISMRNALEKSISSSSSSSELLLDLNLRKSFFFTLNISFRLVELFKIVACRDCCTDWDWAWHFLGWTLKSLADLMPIYLKTLFKSIERFILPFSILDIFPFECTAKPYSFHLFETSPLIQTSFRLISHSK